MGFVLRVLQMHRVAVAGQSCGKTSCDQAADKNSDAAKVPPSRFQKRKGSIYATPSSRDGHVDKNKAEKYFAKIAEMTKGSSK